MSRLYDKFVTILGDIKIFHGPLWMVYDPSSYRIRGPETRKITESLEPGDILLRHYDGYLDNLFIPGIFSHAGLYLGPVTEADRAKLPEGASASRAFETGPCQVAHSTAEGVHLEDILTFLRCDDVAVIRLPDLLHRLRDDARPSGDLLHPSERGVEARLLDGEEVPRQEAALLARDLALGLLGTEYDFAFDFKDGHRMSCTEFVLHSYRSGACALGIEPRAKSLLGGLVRREIIEPDAFIGSPLRLQYVSDEANLKLRRARLPSL